MITEKWLPVPIDEYKDLYLVSNTGKIKNVKTGLILKQKISKNGYCSITLYNKGHRKFVFVHRLVAIAFIPNQNFRELTVDHIDSNPLNNNVSNLSWCSMSDNLKLSHQRGNHSDHLRPVLQIDKNTDEVIRRFESIKEAAIFCNVSYPGIHETLNHKRNRVTAAGYKWKYA